MKKLNTRHAADLVNPRNLSTGDLNAELASLQKVLKDARTPGKPQYGGNTRSIEEDIKEIKYELSTRGRAKDDVQPVDVEQAVALKKHEEGITKSQDKKRGKDEDFGPYASKVAKAYEELRRAARRVDVIERSPSKMVRTNTNAQTARAELEAAKKKYAAILSTARGERSEDSKKATDSIGNTPEQHMANAVKYELGHDRARALDSYRAAANGYRVAAMSAKAEDAALAAKLGEAKARDGITACQSGFDAQYIHPGAGRVKVCDSAESAERTALERTRAGEAVVIVGTTVKPGKAWAGDTDDLREKKKIEVYKIVNNRSLTNRERAEKVTAINKKYERRGLKTEEWEKVEDTKPVRDYAPWPEFDAVVRELSGVRKKLALAETAEEEAAVKPEYERLMKKKRDIERAGPPKKAKDSSFSKLESKLESEGESKKEAGGVAYEAGAKKYGKAGMEKKAAAGRAKDEESLKYMVALKNGRGVIQAASKAEAAKIAKEQFGDKFVRVLGLMNGSGKDSKKATDSKEVQPV